ncbi:MAG: tetratricopeptide repeat protein, partial [Alphaproteobacteria bacterium]
MARIKDILAEAEAAWKAGDAARAEALVEAVLRKAPRHSGARALKRRLGRAGGVSQAEVDAVVARLQAGDLAGAEAALAPLLRRAPGEAVLWHLRGILCQLQGRLEEAINAFRAALARNPALAAARGNLGTALAALERHEEAVRELEAALAADPSAPESWNSLGVARAALGDPEGALEAFGRALALRPDYANALNGRAAVLRGLGRLHEAEADLRQARRLAPDDVAIRCNLANVLVDLGKAAEAETEARAVLAAAPEDAEMQRTLGVVLGQLGRREEALAELRRAVEMPGARAEAWRDLSTHHRFSADDPLIGRMEALISAPDADHETRMHLGFALGKAWHDAGDPDRAWHYWTIGNAEKAKEAPWSTDEAARLLARAREVLADPAWQARVAPGASASERPIFILGVNRSGTTLAEQIIGAHPEVWPGDEQIWIDTRARAELDRLAEWGPEDLARFA